MQSELTVSGDAARELDFEFQALCSAENAPRRTHVPSLVKKCTTGCAAIDGLLKGGVPCGMVTELSGEAASGKSQLCMQLLLTCQLPEARGGLEGASLCLYTDGRFPTKRLMRLASSGRFSSSLPAATGSHARALTDNIYIKEIYDCPHLLDIMHSDVTEFLRNPPRGIPIRLLVLDSVAALFRSEYDNTSDDMSQRSQDMFELSSQMKRLAEQFDLAVVVTNQVVESFPDDATGLKKVSEAQNGGALPASYGPVVPALGMAWSTCINMRLFVSRPRRRSSTGPPCFCGRRSSTSAPGPNPELPLLLLQPEDAQGCRFCLHCFAVVSSPYFARAECSFAITVAGVFGKSGGDQVTVPD